jgi:diguanylate cyclase (GGDEF)-like protein
MQDHHLSWFDSIKMRRLNAAFVVLLSASAWAAVPTITSLKAVRSLTSTQASQGLPVAFEATVTYYNNYRGTNLFVQDGDLPIYVYAKPGYGYVAGDRILVRGRTHASFRPDVVGDQVTLIRHGSAPEPVTASYQQLIGGDVDCRRVTLTARVRSADLVKEDNVPVIYMHLLVDGAYVDAEVIGHEEADLKKLLDAQVQFTGVVAGNFDSKMQLIGIVIEVASFSDIKIIKRASTDLQSLPITAMDEILKGFYVQDLTQRVRIRGTVTYYEPGKAIVLQDGSKSLWVSTQYEGSLQVGSVVDATGFPDARNGYLMLTESEVSPTEVRAPVTARKAEWSELADALRAFELVSTEGKVLAAVRGAAQDEYVLDSNGHLFSAIYRHPDPGLTSLQEMKQAAVGSKIRVAGICIMQYGSQPDGDPVAFDILLRSFDDIELVSSPSWLNIRNLTVALGVLFLGIIGASARGWLLERRVRWQAVAIAASIETEANLERQRSQILEDINSGRKLNEIIEHIVRLVSFSLNGAPCWCRMADGTRFGNAPVAEDGSQVVHQEIPSRAGPLHGELFAALGAAKEATLNVSGAFSVGARLATLAIETRGLYSDLLHRSEFDQLTDAHNRSSLFKHLDTIIAEASRQNRCFGLIYFDLDHFKQVNDRYGHLIGDFYLQQVAQRIDHRLRPGDILARLGGDEFSVLVQNPTGRAELEIIADRLERCFDDPYVINTHRLHGSASFGVAIYPEDGTTRDSLLDAADAAMYVAKHTNKQVHALQFDSPGQPSMEALSESKP